MSAKLHLSSKSTGKPEGTSQSAAGHPQTLSDTKRIAAVSHADVRSVLYAIVDVVSHQLAYNSLFRIGDIDNLQIHINTEGKEININTITKASGSSIPKSNLKDLFLTLQHKNTTEQDHIA